MRVVALWALIVRVVVRWTLVVRVVECAGHLSCPALSRLKIFCRDNTLPSAGQPYRDKSPLGLAKPLSQQKTNRHDRKILPLANPLSRQRTQSFGQNLIATRKPCCDTIPFLSSHTSSQPWPPLSRHCRNKEPGCSVVT